MVEMQINEDYMLQIYAVGNMFTAVLVDKFGEVKKNNEFSPIELSKILLAKE